MSFQAYLDNIETKTGKTPRDFIALAKEKGFTADTKAGDIAAWLKNDFGLGHGHAMAMVHVIKKGPAIGGKHVNTGGAHSDESDTLKLDGVKIVIRRRLFYRERHAVRDERTFYAVALNQPAFGA